VFGTDPARKTLVTSAPFSDTGVAALLSCVICTSTSPPLTRSGLVDSVLISSTAAATFAAHASANAVTPTEHAVEHSEALRIREETRTTPAPIRCCMGDFIFSSCVYVYFEIDATNDDSRKLITATTVSNARATASGSLHARC